MDCTKHFCFKVVCMPRQISYYDAVYYKGNHYILCNEIVQLDDSIFQNCDTDDDIYQFYISDCFEKTVFRYSLFLF